ncbi:MAG: hypothetical protein JSR91_00315 [Proteobacteria bacterium]|nr:hypothetical protein [Pseudomonadota bacterium]
MTAYQLRSLRLEKEREVREAEIRYATAPKGSKLRRLVELQQAREEALKIGRPAR